MNVIRSKRGIPGKATALAAALALQVTAAQGADLASDTDVAAGLWLAEQWLQYLEREVEQVELARSVGIDY